MTVYHFPLLSWLYCRKRLKLEAEEDELEKAIEEAQVYLPR